MSPPPQGHPGSLLPAASAERPRIEHAAGAHDVRNALFVRHSARVCRRMVEERMDVEEVELRNRLLQPVRQARGVRKRSRQEFRGTEGKTHDGARHSAGLFLAAVCRRDGDANAVLVETARHPDDRVTRTSVAQSEGGNYMKNFHEFSSAFLAQ